MQNILARENRYYVVDRLLDANPSSSRLILRSCLSALAHKPNNQPGGRAHDARPGGRRAQAGGEARSRKPRVSRSLPEGRTPLLLVGGQGEGRDNETSLTTFF